jgi:aquaporin Z
VTTHPATDSERHSAAAFANPTREWRRIFAEAWGTFLLVLVGAGAAIGAAIDPGRIHPDVAAASPGLIVMVVIYFMGSVSGAHINPAVTLAFALRRNFPWSRVPGYIAAQLLGAMGAAAFLQLIFGLQGDLGATLPGPGFGEVKALLVETVLTAGLVNAILGTASGARNVGTNAAIAVGGYISVAGIWAASITGASMNPARTLGPDIVRWSFAETWIYLAGPLAGALIGVGFEWILKGRPTRAGTKAAQGTDRD